MSAGRHFVAVDLLGVTPGILEEIYHPVIQHLIVAVPEKKGAMNCLRGFTHYILHVPNSTCCCLVVGGTVDKIEHVLVIERLIISLLIFLRKTAGEKPDVELSTLVVGEVGPVLL